MNLDDYFTLHTKINSKWIKDLNIRPEIIKLLEENIGSKLLGMGLGNDCFNLTPKAKATKAKIKKWHYIKLEPYAPQRRSSTELIDNLLNGRKYLHIIYLIRD